MWHPREEWRQDRAWGASIIGIESHRLAVVNCGSKPCLKSDDNGQLNPITRHELQKIGTGALGVSEKGRTGCQEVLTSAKKSLQGGKALAEIPKLGGQAAAV